MWKVINISSNPPQDIKIAVAKNNTTTVGVILKPNQFCVVDQRMTSSLDAQVKRKFIAIDEKYAGGDKLELCVAYDMSDAERAVAMAKTYVK